MQSIGERLEEARKRRGISIREASEATKIRGDFLLGFENNQFDVDLPEIYVRGFLRNYATFLKIDSEKIVTDFNASQLGETKPGRKEPRELFGRMELPERPRQAPESSGSGGTGSTGKTRRLTPEESAEKPAGEIINANLASYIRVGTVIAAGVIILLLIIWLIVAIVNSMQDTGASTRESNTPPAAQVQAETITLIALDSVRVKVTQVSDETTLFDGPLARGETKTITRLGPVLIAYDIGRNLNVEKNGQRYKMPVDDIGRSSFP